MKGNNCGVFEWFKFIEHERIMSYIKNVMHEGRHGARGECSTQGSHIVEYGFDSNKFLESIYHKEMEY